MRKLIFLKRIVSGDEVVSSRVQNIWEVTLDKGPSPCGTAL